MRYQRFLILENECQSNDWFLYEMQHWGEMGNVYNSKKKFLEDSCEFVKMLYKMKSWKGTHPAFTCSKLTIEN